MQRQFLLNVAGSWVYCDALIIAVESQLVIPHTGENAATYSLPKVLTVKKSTRVRDQAVLGDMTPAIIPCANTGCRNRWPQTSRFKSSGQMIFNIKTPPCDGVKHLRLLSLNLRLFLSYDQP